MEIEFQVSNFKISKAHAVALKRIQETDDYYKKFNISKLFEDWIEDYLLRENGKLGKIINGKYIEEYQEELRKL